MAREPSGCDGPIELAFDVTKTSTQVKFLGLLGSPDKSDGGLQGVFDWTCQACGAVNRATIGVEPQQAFLSRWSCTSCSRLTLVQFRARAGAEWIAQHTLAVTGKAFHAPPEDAGLAACARARPRTRKRDGQTIFAWIAIPALLGIILLGVMDMRRVSRTSASPHLADSGAPTSTPSTRLEGYWVSEQHDHMLCFEAVDPVSRVGTYTVVSRSSRQADTVPFKILHEEVTGEQVVIRQEPDQLSDASESRMAPASAHAGRPDSATSDVTIYVPRDGRSMTWIDMREGQPVVTMYRNAGETRIP
jgi:hypothetical protein